MVSRASWLSADRRSMNLFLGEKHLNPLVTLMPECAGARGRITDRWTRRQRMSAIRPLPDFQ